MGIWGELGSAFFIGSLCGRYRGAARAHARVSVKGGGRRRCTVDLADLAFPRLRERLSRRRRGKEEEAPTGTPDSEYSTAIIPQRREGLEGDSTPTAL